MPRDPNYNQLEFEREKWRADLEMRGREIALKEKEQSTSKWRNPLPVAVFAAAAAAAGNAVVAMINGWQQVALENSKAESTRILEMIKTGNTETAANNLDFLIQSGLVTDPDRVEKLRAFLKERQPGSGPSLPAGSRFDFEPSDFLTPSLQSELQKRLDGFVAYLDDIGFPVSQKKPRIKTDKLRSPIAYYDPNTAQIMIDVRVISDPTVALHEWTHHALTTRNWPPAPGGQILSIEAGLADYFVGSFLNTPKTGEIAAKVPGAAPVRTLSNNRKFPELAGLSDPFDIIYNGAEVWGGALWEMRTKIGKKVFDPMLAEAWLSTSWPRDDAGANQAFLAALLAVAPNSNGSDQRLQLTREILMRREFPLPAIKDGLGK